MRINDHVNFTGNVVIEVIDTNGNTKQIINVPNLIVSVGKNYIAGRLVPDTTFDDINYDTFKTPVRCLSHMAIGSSNEKPKLSDTGLGDFKQISELLALTVENNVITANAVFGPTAGNAFMLAEAGLFNNGVELTDNIMLCRTTFTNVVKNPEDSLNITWTITVA